MIYSAHPTILGKCFDCCACPEPVIQSQYRSAYKAKCVISPFTGSSNKMFLKSTLSGSTTVCTQTRSSSGAIVYDRLTCALVSNTWSTVTSGSQIPPCTGSDGGVEVTLTETTRTETATGPNSSGSIVQTLSDEYTTEQLLADAFAALAEGPLSAVHSGNPSASVLLSADEANVGVSNAIFKFAFKVPKLGRGNKYIISWVEHWHPYYGGEDTTEVKTYTWDGIIPAGYDENDESTWPVSAEFALDNTTTNSFRYVECVTATCSGDAPIDPCNP